MHEHASGDAARYPGEHAPIISQALWEKAQSILREPEGARLSLAVGDAGPAKGPSVRTHRPRH